MERWKACVGAGILILLLLVSCAPPKQEKDYLDCFRPRQLRIEEGKYIEYVERPGNVMEPYDNEICEHGRA